RVAAGDGGIVEADVGGQAAADPCPLPLERERDDVICRRSVSKVLPGLVEGVAQLLDPGLVFGLRGHLHDRGLRGGEQRSPDEFGAAAVGAGRQLVYGIKRDWVVALGTAKSSGPRYVARSPSSHGAISFGQAGRSVIDGGRWKRVVRETDNPETRS